MTNGLILHIDVDAIFLKQLKDSLPGETTSMGNLVPNLLICDNDEKQTALINLLAAFHEDTHLENQLDAHVNDA